jgi:hypothetical protein
LLLLNFGGTVRLDNSYLECQIMTEQDFLNTETGVSELMLAEENLVFQEANQVPQERVSHNLYRKLLAGGAAAALAVAGAAEAKLMGPKAGEAAIRHCSKYVVASIGINNGHEKKSFGEVSAAQDWNNDVQPHRLNKVRYYWQPRHLARFCGLVAYENNGDKVYPAPDHILSGKGDYTDRHPQSSHGFSELLVYFRAPKH